MTDVNYDSEFSTNGTSSVIDSVMYDGDQKILVVELSKSDYWGSPVLAGYLDVPVEVFNQMKLINDDPDSSLGAYWNRFVKPFYAGTTVDEIEPRNSAPLVEDAPGPQVVTGNVFVAPLEDNIFILHYSSTDTPEGDLADIAIHASDEAGALELFEDIAALGGWDAAEVRAITRIIA